MRKKSTRKKRVLINPPLAAERPRPHSQTHNSYLIRSAALVFLVGVVCVMAGMYIGASMVMTSGLQFIQASNAEVNLEINQTLLVEEVLERVERMNGRPPDVLVVEEGMVG